MQRRRAAECPHSRGRAWAAGRMSMDHRRGGRKRGSGGAAAEGEGACACGVRAVVNEASAIHTGRGGCLGLSDSRALKSDDAEYERRPSDCRRLVALTIEALAPRVNEGRLGGVNDDGCSVNGPGCVNDGSGCRLLVGADATAGKETEPRKRGDAGVGETNVEASEQSRVARHDTQQLLLINSTSTTAA
eukprot:CAMPEP_0174725632 /NCGR_PEP_ID=MMETSP1094-20130205/46065_1 /TAXON_ID=156173 /ORGANISM="Chrysochromulina brevifilum, Strain UTEX LB 985" /LENGTH=188 /DNA_ID=CAMNT_0015927073 /DNA_START=304 /DNA_END=867 /DNA_ORIENTATION=-